MKRSKPKKSTTETENMKTGINIKDKGIFE